MKIHKFRRRTGEIRKIRVSFSYVFFLLFFSFGVELDVNCGDAVEFEN